MLLLWFSNRQRQVMLGVRLHKVISMEKLKTIKKYLIVISVIFFIFICYLITKGIVDYKNYRQASTMVLVRDDSRETNLNDIICGKEDENTLFFKAMVYFSASVYNDVIKKTYGNKGEWVFVEEVSVSNGDWLFKEKMPPSNSEKWLVGGLKYSVWKNVSKKIVVIVFRGTEGVIDFHSNLHWLFKYFDFAFDQYEQLPVILDKIISPYKVEKYKFYTAGHSLGGGLAQHAVYQSSDVSKAFVFDSSPITGWTDLSTKKQIENAIDSQIYRVHEHGEILEFFRYLIKGGDMFYPGSNQNPYIKEYQFNFDAGNLFDQHNIDKLSDRINNIKCSLNNKK